MDLKNIATVCVFISALATGIYAQDTAIPIEAEDADSLGDDYTIVSEGENTYITPATDFASTTNPGMSDKVATFDITFPASGTYDFYARVRVGPDTYDDDSFYFASDLGTRPPDVDSLWIRVNSIDYGATGPNEYVTGPEDNTAGFEIFKWINASEQGEGPAGGTVFEVEEDNLTRTFQIGSREDGFDIDMIAFGNADLFYTVSNLENAEAGVPEIPKTEDRLVVDLSDSLRPVTHAASGALYGVTENIPGDIESSVVPLQPRMYVQPARSGTGHQQPAGAALAVSERLAFTTAEVAIRLPDINPGWPYQYPGWENWADEVRSVISDKLESGRSNYYGYEIWNEQHGTWDADTNGDFFSELWEPTYDLIRSMDPEAKIIGPSDSYYSRSRIEEFLTYGIENDCLPDIISWHELGGSANVSRNVENYRSLESELGIEPRPISINEYSHSTRAYEGAPGPSASFVAKFERSGVHSAAISFWFPNLPGRLGSLMTAGNEKGGGWWFYKWYGDMSGHMVTVTPPDPNSDGLDGFANLDTEEEYASVCFGGDYIGTMDVEINGIPTAFGDSVDVKMEYVPWSDKDTPVSGPETVSLATHSNAGGSVTIPVEVTDPLYGYRVSIAPVGQIVSTEQLAEAVPAEFGLSQNFPNPFNPTTRIEYTLPEASKILLTMYNVNGQKVKVLEEGFRPAGTYQVEFEAGDLASGIYLYRIVTDKFTQVKRMVLLK